MEIGKNHFPLLAACSICTSGFFSPSYDTSILIEDEYNVRNERRKKRIVACCYDMTIEAAFAKLSICSFNIDPFSKSSYFRGINKMENLMRVELTDPGIAY